MVDSIVQITYGFPNFFCLIVLSITEGWVLKSPAMIMKLSVSSFNSVNYCFIYFEVLLSGTYIFMIRYIHVPSHIT